MTLDEAIRHAEEIAEKFWSEGVNEEHCRNCGFEHAQLAEWLKELKARRGEIEDEEGSVLEEITINGRTYLHKRHPITDPIFEEDDLPFPEVLL